MDTFVDSSWYYLRYTDALNNEKAFDSDVANAWTPVDQYIGGIEHAVMHLLYSRFFHKALRDLGYVNSDEPFKRLLTQGMVLGNSYYSKDERRYLFSKEVKWENNKAYSKASGEELVVKMEKMSKSKNNGEDPAQIVEKYGADAARLFVLFAAPPEKELEWNENGLGGAYRFINRIFLLINETAYFIDKSAIVLSNRTKQDEKLQIKLHKTIKKVTQSMEDNFHFNTAIASLMELLNDMTTYRQEVIDKDNFGSESKKIWYEVLYNVSLMIAPFVPHIADEMLEVLKVDKTSFELDYPIYEEELTKDTSITLVIQVNGKLRDNITVDIDLDNEKVNEIALSQEKVKSYIDGKEIVKIINVKNKLVNIVIK